MNPQEIGEGVLTEEQLIYKENIIDHYKHPRNRRKIDSASVHYSDFNPLCGDKIDVYIVINNDTVTDVGFEGKGCAISQAAMSMLTERIKGMSAAEVAHISREDILQLLGIPIGVVRMKCAMLGLRATQKALEAQHD
jgi:nitrogen fixation protein NifU and related proteins